MYLALEDVVPPVSHRTFVSHGTWELHKGELGFAYATFTLYGLLFQANSATRISPLLGAPQLPDLRRNLGCSAFARRY